MLIYSDCVLDTYLRAPKYDYFCGCGLDQHWVGLHMWWGAQKTYLNTRLVLKDVFCSGRITDGTPDARL